MFRKSGLLAIGVAAAIGFATTAQAFTISYFNDGTYVDSITESVNMANQLTGLGHTVNGFSGTSDAAWTTALTGATHLVIPELEVADLAAALSATAETAIRDFVQGGGIMVIAGTNAGTPQFSAGLLNSVFGFALVEGTGTAGGASALNAANAAGTPFAGGPDPLTHRNGTFLLPTASLPVGALSIYESGAETSVFLKTEGVGQLTYIGYDWFAGTDASWGDVLDRALQRAVAAPEPATLAILGLGLAGLGFARRRRTH